MKCAARSANASRKSRPPSSPRCKTRTLTATAKHRHAEPPRLISQLQGDLDWIVMKALEKDRKRRYETSNAMAMDLQRYLNNEPIVARPRAGRIACKNWCDGTKWFSLRARPSRWC
jgi:hypothetical protein